MGRDGEWQRALPVVAERVIVGFHLEHVGVGSVECQAANHGREEVNGKRGCTALLGSAHPGKNQNS